MDKLSIDLSPSDSLLLNQTITEIRTRLQRQHIRLVTENKDKSTKSAGPFLQLRKDDNHYNSQRRTKKIYICVLSSYQFYIVFNFGIDKHKVRLITKGVRLNIT